MQDFSVCSTLTEVAAPFESSTKGMLRQVVRTKTHMWSRSYGARARSAQIDRALRSPVSNQIDYVVGLNVVHLQMLSFTELMSMEHEFVVVGGENNHSIAISGTCTIRRRQGTRTESYSYHKIASSSSAFLLRRVNLVSYFQNNPNFKVYSSSQRDSIPLIIMS